MCSKFKQRQQTVHLAILYMDILLLDPKLFDVAFKDDHFFAKRSKAAGLSGLKFNESLFVGTCMLLASKFYEPDENLVMIAEI